VEEARFPLLRGHEKGLVTVRHLGVDLSIQLSQTLQHEP